MKQLCCSMKCHEGLARCPLKHELSVEARHRDRSRAVNGDTAHIVQGLIVQQRQFMMAYMDRQ